MDSLERSVPKKRWISKKGMEVVGQLLNNQLETGFKQCAIMRTTDVSEQARRLPRSFVGDCAYLYMSEVKNHKDVNGNYQIVFAKTGPAARPNAEHFTPSNARKITIRTDVKKIAPRTIMNDILKQGARGAVELRFDEYRAYLGWDAPLRESDFDAPARIVHQQAEEDNEKDEDGVDTADLSRLERILAMGINAAGDNRMYFGMKEMDRDPQNEMNTCLGFRFVELELDCVDPDYGTKDCLVIVAVKLDDAVRDVGSPFILAQRVHFPDPSLYDML